MNRGLVWSILARKDDLPTGFDNMITIGLSGCDNHARKIKLMKQAKPDEVTLGYYFL